MFAALLVVFCPIPVVGGQAAHGGSVSHEFCRRLPGTVAALPVSPSISSFCPIFTVRNGSLYRSSSRPVALGPSLLSSFLAIQPSLRPSLSFFQPTFIFCILDPVFPPPPFFSQVEKLVAQLSMFGDDDRVTTYSSAFCFVDDEREWANPLILPCLVLLRPRRPRACLNFLDSVGRGFFVVVVVLGDILFLV